MEQKRIEAQMRKHFRLLGIEEVKMFVFDPQMQPRTRQLARDELVRRNKEGKK
ncbi:hypothetical protein N2384_01610 [Bacillus paralicheniformis]|uniref:hypothetical protein n=1 Tax=Bacillus paralicheniformis TaxID=1648923 RepID=UPI0021A5EE68|nr:hypothetical protein [Bacillus paralicheniformis]UWS61953.1 hypothetical protein N2384_01610 [Bacillus paralicheniformis]